VTWTQSPMARRIHGERLAVLGWGRAVLLQFAHPLVAAGVAEHSSFDEAPVEFLRRTYRTVHAMLGLTFGPEERARAVAARINGIHDRVHGKLTEPAGIFPAGLTYSARDPELLRWVHATLIESALLSWDRFVEPLTAEEKDRYCAEASMVGPLLGVPSDLLPATVSDLDAYLRGMYESGAIHVTRTARTLSARLLSPPLGPLGWPFVELVRLTAVGLLPAPVRSAYGFEWDASKERALQGVGALLRNTRRLVPAALREWPESRTREPPTAPPATSVLEKLVGRVSRG